MKFGDLVSTAFASLLQHKLRSSLALLGVTLGSLLLFSSLAGGLGVLNAVNQRLSVGNRLVEIQVYGGHKTKTVTADAARDAGITQKMSEQRRLRIAQAMGVGGREPVPVNLETIGALQAVQDVESAWARIGLQATARIRSERGEPTALHQHDRWVHAVSSARPPIEQDLSAIIVAGRDAVVGKDEALVSELLLYQCGFRREQDVAKAIGLQIYLIPRTPSLENLFLLSQKLRRSPETNVMDASNQKVTFADVDQQLRKLEQSQSMPSRPLKIVGVFRVPTDDEVSLNPGVSPARNSNILMPYSAACYYLKELGQGKRNLNAVVHAKSAERVKAVESALQASGYQTRSLSDIALRIRTGVLLITAIITLIAGGALFISAIGIANTMIMNVMERRGDIAIMKSIGAKDRDINAMFLVEGTLIGVIGGVAGLVVGWSLTRLCGSYIRQMLEEKLSEPLGADVFSYPAWLVICTPLVAAIVTMIATLVPARRAAKLDPVSALREL